MNKTVEFLRKSKIFFLATTDGDQPRVRPFGAVAEIDGKLYIASNNTKKVFKQMLENPKIELSAMLSDDEWIRITGTVKVNPDVSAKAEFLRQCPISGYTTDDGIFEVLYFVDGIVEINSFDREPISFNIYKI